MKTIIITRYSQDENQTLGSCVVKDEDNNPLFVSLSLERGWVNNEKRISCVPVGEYFVELEHSNKFKKYLWEIKNVPNRSECKFHSANYWYQLNGCIALGLRLKKINSDNYYDISNSSNTMKAFHQALKGEIKVKLIIKDEN